MADDIYQIPCKRIDGSEQDLSEFKGKVMLIVNTASKCGFTPQYKGLQELHDKYADKGFSVLGFPCNQFLHQEPEGEGEIQEFCSLNFGVTFPMFAKVDVNGDDAHPLFNFLKDKAPGMLGSGAVKWNFTKFLVDAKGNVLRRYAPKTEPKAIEKDLVAELG